MKLKMISKYEFNLQFTSLQFFAKANSAKCL